MSDAVIAPTILSEAMTWPSRARGIQVYDVHSYQRAAALLLDIKDTRRKIADAYDPHIARAFATHKMLVADKKSAEAPLVEAEDAIKTALAIYDAQQEQERQRETERLRAEARAIEEQRRLDEAARLEREAAATGDVTLAEDAAALLARPIEVPAIFALPTTPKVSGITHKTLWSAEVVDFAKLVQYVANKPEMLNLLLPNQAALNQMAKAQRDHLAIDGVVAVKTNTVAAGGGRG